MSFVWTAETRTATNIIPVGMVEFLLDVKEAILVLKSSNPELSTKLEAHIAEYLEESK